MCIALVSTAHPEYALILLDNRDEFLSRPTAPATWWPSPRQHVLGGRDLLRPAQGTWLAVTRDGRIAVLTNFREECEEAVGAQSRGGMVTAFLAEEGDKQTTDDFVKNLVASGAPQHVGGFSLVCGRVGEPLAVISNRVTTEKGISWIAANRDETVGLSNAAFGDRSWNKVVLGEKLVEQAISLSTKQHDTEDQFIEKLLNVLSTDTLPRVKNPKDGLETHINQLRDTIFVPVLGRNELQDKAPDDIRASKADDMAHVMENGSASDLLGMSGLYGTQKQTVVLARYDGTIRYIERTLYDTDSVAIEKGCGDADFTFQIEN